VGIGSEDVVGHESDGNLDDGGIAFPKLNSQNIFYVLGVPHSDEDDHEMVDELDLDLQKGFQLL
jgi:hypothetical protein